MSPPGRIRLLRRTRNLQSRMKSKGNHLDEMKITIFFRLLLRSEHLESLVNQEIGDIGDILQSIKIIQENK